MTRLFFALGTIALISAAPGEARTARHHALPPVPQSAEIAALNRESLAKIAPVSTDTQFADSRLAAPAPAVKKAAHPKR